MSRRYMGTIGFALLVTLAVPHTAHASIWDLIWGLSGPQMMGPVFHCEYDVQHTENYGTVECRVLDYRIVGALAPRPMRRAWLSLDTGYYFSTGRDTDGFDFDWFGTHMVAFEPLFEIRSYTSPDQNFALHHGLVGVTYGILFGEQFRTFDKAGIKFRPIGVTLNRRFNASFVMRWYPNGFTPDEFGVVQPRLENVERPDEMVYGFSVGWLWGPR